MICSREIERREEERKSVRREARESFVGSKLVAILYSKYRERLCYSRTECLGNSFLRSTVVFPGLWAAQGGVGWRQGHTEWSTPKTVLSTQSGQQTEHSKYPGMGWDCLLRLLASCRLRDGTPPGLSASHNGARTGLWSSNATGATRRYGIQLFEMAFGDWDEQIAARH